MTAALSFLALAVAVAALGHGAWRAAAVLGAQGALRLVAAAPIAATAAALTLLILGRIGLSGSQPAVIASALALGAIAHRALPRATSAPRLWLTPRERLALGAAAGLGVAWTGWIVKYPGLGNDPLVYHLPESLLWVQQGDAGAVRQVLYLFPVGNYPLADELLVSWVLAASHWIAAASLWAPAMVGLTATAAVTGLRRAGVGLLPAALAPAAILALPIWAQLFIGPHSDLGALAWLTSAVTLAAAARSRPSLLIPAVLAGGLAIGTKTTTAPMLIAAGVLLVRPPLPRARLLVPALVAAGIVGGLWYVRNLILHGSPLWPFVQESFGDPIPALYREAGATFLGTIGRSLAGDRPGLYFEQLATAPALLLAAPVAAAFVRTRRVVLAAAVAMLGALIWSKAPFTGRPEDPLLDFTFGTTRYLVPALGAAVLTLALATADAGPRTRRAVTLLLAVSAVWSAVKSLQLGFPEVPPALTLTTGALAGAVVLRARPRWALPLALLALAIVCVRVTDQFAGRVAQNVRLTQAGAIGFLARQPGFDTGDAPVYTAPATLAALAGDRLTHPLRFLPARTSCDRVRALHGWFVLGTPPPTRYLRAVPAVACLAGVTPVYDDGRYRVYDRRR